MKTNIAIDSTIVHVGGRKKLPTNGIINMDADINYTIITMDTGQKIIVATTLKKIEAKMLPHKNFVRVNKSTIINTDHASIQGDAFVLPNERIITFSRRRLKQFKTVNQSIL
jgi:DNA-binding LytR/AlgR family response regulator